LEANPFSAPGAVIALETCDEATAEVVFWREGGPERRTRASPAGTAHRVEAIGMRPDTAYQLRPEVTRAGGEAVAGEVFTFQSPPAPPELPPWTFTARGGAAPREGVVLFGPGPTTRGAWLVGVDAEGQLAWWYHDAALDDVFWASRQAQPLEGGELLVQVPVGWRVISPAGQTLWEIYYPDEGLAPFHHDAAALPGGGFLLLVAETRSVEIDGEWVDLSGDVVLEVDASREVVSRWSSFDHLDTTRFPGPASRTELNFGEGLDWTHANALVYLPDDDSYLLSLRSQSWIVKVDRASGEVIWRLGPGGDFKLEAGDWFYAQHAPEPGGDGSMMLFDNGNERPPHKGRFSRAVRYTLDVDALEAREVWSHVLPEYSDAMGDANALPGGGALVTSPGSLIEPVAPARIIEVDAAGEVAWEITLEGPQVYRADWVEGF